MPGQAQGQLTGYLIRRRRSSMSVTAPHRVEPSVEVPTMHPLPATGTGGAGGRKGGLYCRPTCGGDRTRMTPVSIEEAAWVAREMI